MEMVSIFTYIMRKNIVTVKTKGIMKAFTQMTH